MAARAGTRRGKAPPPLSHPPLPTTSPSSHILPPHPSLPMSQQVVARCFDRPYTLCVSTLQMCILSMLNRPVPVALETLMAALDVDLTDLVTALYPLVKGLVRPRSSSITTSPHGLSISELCSRLTPLAPLPSPPHAAAHADPGRDAHQPSHPHAPVGRQRGLHATHAVLPPGLPEKVRRDHPARRRGVPTQPRPRYETFPPPLFPEGKKGVEARFSRGAK